MGWAMFAWVASPVTDVVVHDCDGGFAPPCTNPHRGRGAFP